MKLLSKFKGHPLFSGLVAIQLLFLAFLLARSFRPAALLSFKGADFTPAEYFSVTEYEDSIGVEVSRAQEPNLMMNLITSLPSGAYDIEVQYESISDPDYPTQKVSDSTGWVELFLLSNPDSLKADPITLSDDSNTATGRVWLEFGAGAPDLVIAVNYAGSGSLLIRSVTLEECTQYRAARILGFLCLFAALDLGILFFSGRLLPGQDSRRKYVILGVLSITLFSSLLFCSEYLFVCRDGTDLIFHLNRIQSLADAILEGQFPQRIQTQMLNGYGYISPLFYGELFLLPFALLLLLAVPVQTVYQILVFSVNFATAATTYCCLKRVSGDWKKGLFGSAIYTLASYRLLKTLIWRNAVGELFAALFLPLIIYGFYQLYTAPDGKKFSLRDCLPLIIGLTGLIQCHILSCEIAALFLLPFLLILWKKTFQPQRFAALAKTAILTFLLNVWFLVPFLQSLFSMELEVSVRDPGNLNSTALQLHQIFTLFPIPFNFWDTELYDQMLLSIGPALVIAFFCFLVYAVKRQDFAGDGKEFRPIAFFFLLGSAALFLSSRYFLWKEPPKAFSALYNLLAMIQFPWRFLGFAIPLLTFGTVLLLKTIESRFSPKAGWILMGVMLGLSVFVTSCFYSVAADRMGVLTLYTLDSQDRMDVVQGEYLPADTNLTGLEERLPLTGDGVESRELERQGTRSLWWCENTSDADSWVDLPLLAYDNYYAFLEDGTPVSLSTGENNRIRVTVPARYSGSIQVEYRSPLLWRVCEGVSLVTLAGCAMVLVRTGRRNAPKSAG